MIKRVLNGFLCVLAGFLTWLGYTFILNICRGNSSDNLFIAVIPAVLTIYGLGRTLERNYRLAQKHKDGD